MDRSLFLINIIIVFFLFSTLAQAEIHPTARQLKKLIKLHCVNCHVGSGEEVGRYGDFIKAGVLQQLEKQSPNILFKKIESDEMPRIDYGDVLSVEEKNNFLQVIQTWYEAALPQLELVEDISIISPEDILELVSKDLQKQSERKVKNIRYFSLASLYNNPQRRSQLKENTQALFKLLNSLSWARDIVVPRDISGLGVVFAIYLPDFNWTLDHWDKLTGKKVPEDGISGLSVYPYTQEYKNESQLYKRIQKIINSELPIVRADWIIRNASQAPIYESVLELPNKLSELERMLQIDRLKNISDINVLRAGFNDSGVSQHNRIIERHSTLFGAYWISYDFSSSLGLKNIFVNPLGPVYKERPFSSSAFRHDGGEVIFSLPNGLQAYMLVDADDNSIEEAPTSIVSDPSRPDRTVRNGISCMGCHSTGMIFKTDQISNSFHEGSFMPIADQIAVFSMYGKKDEMNEKMKLDQTRFLNSLKKAGISQSQPEVVKLAVQIYDSSMNLEQLASELNTSVEFIKKGLKEGKFSEFPLAVFLFSQASVSSIKRESFEQNYSLLKKSISYASPL